MRRFAFLLRSLTLAYKRLPSCCDRPWSFLCVHASLAHLSFQEDTSHTELGPHLMASFSLHYFLKGPVSKHSHLGGQGFKMRTGGVGRGGDTVQSIIVVALTGANNIMLHSGETARRWLGLL